MLLVDDGMSSLLEFVHILEVTSTATYTSLEYIECDFSAADILAVERLLTHNYS